MSFNGFKSLIINYLPLILVLILASILRLIWLNNVPPAVGGDELTYLITAKSILLSGSDITGKWNPLSVFLFNFPPGQGQAELLYFILIPFVAKFSLFWSRFPNAFFGVLVVYLIYLITSKFFGAKAGIVAALVSAVNPWFIYISRTTYEMPVATFFYLLSLYFLITLKGKKILFTIPVLLLAFYSYIATKAVFVPFVFTAVIYSYFLVNKKKYRKEYLSIVIFSVLLFIFYFVSIIVHPGTSRIGDLFTPNNPAVTNQVNFLRHMSISNFLTDVLVNKYTVFFTVLLVKAFNIFSTGYLFINGDKFFSIYNQGVFYYPDAIFLILGLIFVFLKNRKVFFLLFSLILFSIIPQLIYTASTDVFTPHNTLMFPFFIIFIGVGIYETVNYFKNRNYFYASSIIISLIYLFFIVNFLNIYFYQFPLRGNFDFPVRIASKYAELSSKNSKVFVYTERKEDVFNKFLFYSNSLNKNTYLTVRNNIANKYYGIGNIRFEDCNNSINPLKNNNVIIYDDNCGGLKRNGFHLSISSLSDGGENYEIFNDAICSKFYLNPYPMGITISDFSIENMNVRKFCQTFVNSR